MNIEGYIQFNLSYSFYELTVFLGIPEIPKLNSLQAYTGWYWIFIVTIIATYSGNLMSFLAVQRPPLPINSLEELVQNPDWEADVYSGASSLDLFKVIILGIYHL